ncbi:hypothetical protein [Marinoscillum sp. MHG1-6]|uniref:hypothetical protein n=1 Tax=Marinoscillum sp. MHG1-6 TaxID=2959627 RepID=UPI0021572654|nr:hypothetical protein [Marinoscillum sp. MHG1-6]
MKKIFLLPSILFFSLIASAQESESLGQKIDSLTYDWDEKSEELNSYDGLSRFCTDKDYRLEFIETVEGIHHYDSVLYAKLTKAVRISHDKEIEKTIKDIEKFEEEYSMKKFIHFLHEECKGRSEIERNSKDLKTEIGSESYDSQVYMIELELNKYVKHITKRVDMIRKHAHHLHVK